MSSARVLLLFGAGASYDSGGDDGFGNRPPLGVELFDRLRSLAQSGMLREPNGWADPTLAPLFADVGNGVDFETGMVNVVERNHGKQVWPLMRDMERYIWQFRLPTDNTYSALLEQLLNAGCEITISTLNYDLLLEIAIFNSGWGWSHSRFSGLNGNVGQVFRVFKLHGSVNWVTDGRCEVGEMSAAPSRIGSACHSVVSYGDFEARLTGPRLIRDDRGAIMAMYEPDKLVLPEGWLVREVQADWQEQVGKVDVMVCAGIRPINGGDPHIWNPIRNGSDAKLISVDPGDGSEDLYRPVAGSKRTTANGGWVHINRGFASAVRDGAIKAALDR